MQLSTCSREDSRDDSDDVVVDSGVVDSGRFAPAADAVSSVIDSGFVAVASGDFAVFFVVVIFDSPFVVVVVVDLPFVVAAVFWSTILSLVSSLAD